LPDFVISGAGGFIGRHLSATLAARGFTVEDYKTFRDGGANAGTFVHCANIHDNPRDNAAFTADVLATVAPRVVRFVELQSFATLHGHGRINPAAFNCGKMPLLIAPYPLGKLLQEHVLVRDAPRYPRLAVRLVYLPAVLGEGGSWSAVRAAAQRNGVVLPPRMRADARANYIEVGDLAGYIAATAGDTAAGVARIILNRSDSAALRWQDFFAGAAIAEDTTAAGLARLAATMGALAAYRAMTTPMPLRLPAGAIDRRAPRPHQAALAKRPSTEPVRFTGLIAHVVRTQSYIAANAPTP